MDDTRELTAEHLERAAGAGEILDSLASLDVEAALDAVERRAEERAALAGPARLEAAATAALEGALEALEFERGYFLVEWQSADAHGEVQGLEVLVSRARDSGDGRTLWKVVRNPDYAFDRGAVAESLASSGVVARDGCLGRPRAEEEARPRAVLCRSCRLSSCVRAVFYVEGRVGPETIRDEQRAVFSRLVERLAPLWARSFLEAQVERLEKELAGATAAAAGDSAESPAPAEPEEPLAALPEAPPAAYYGILGEDEKLRKVFEVIEKVKDSDLNVCIFGESGTGKELVARAIHAAGRRAAHPFVSENCGAIAENLLESELFGHIKGSFTGADEDRKGLFELAHGGTLFLDEIGDMSETMQRKLLRALQEGVIRPIGSKDTVKVDVRVICASNRDLKHLVQKKEFRADLYYRLNVISIAVPPLRERRGDIPLLVGHFAREVEESDGVKKRFGESALKALVQYGWPGNVRELRNVVRRVLLTSDRRVIARKDVVPYLSGEAHGTACLGENLARDDDQFLLRIPMRQTFNEIIDECERLVLSNALREHGWNKSRVTKALGIPRQSLYNKIAKYRLRRQRADEGDRA